MQQRTGQIAVACDVDQSRPLECIQKENSSSLMLNPTSHVIARLFIDQTCICKLPW